MCGKYDFHKTGPEGIEEIRKMLYQSKDVEFEEIKEFLIDMAMLYVKVLENDIGGSLSLKNEICILGNNGRNCLGSIPLSENLGEWKDFHDGKSMDEADFIKTLYKQLRVTYL